MRLSQCHHRPHPTPPRRLNSKHVPKPRPARQRPQRAGQRASSSESFTRTVSASKDRPKPWTMDGNARWAIHDHLVTIPQITSSPEGTILIGGVPKVYVALDVRFKQLVEFDCSTGVMRSLVELVLRWHDERLAFIGKDYDPNWDSERDTVAVYADSPGNSEVWVPLVVPSEQSEANVNETLNYIYRIHVYDNHARLARGWNVEWTRTLVLSSLCQMWLPRYPFDDHSCNISFMPWESDDSSYLVNAGNVEDSRQSAALQVQSEFSVAAVNLSHLYLTSDDNLVAGLQDRQIPVVILSLKVIRNSMYICNNVVVPLCFMLLFGYVTFWMPWYWYDRVTFAFSLMLTAFTIMNVNPDVEVMTTTSTVLEDFQSRCLVLLVIPAVETTVVSLVHHSLQTSSDMATAAYVRACDMVFRRLEQQFAGESTPMNRTPIHVHATPRRTTIPLPTAVPQRLPTLRGRNAEASLTATRNTETCLTLCAPRSSIGSYLTSPTNNSINAFLDCADTSYEMYAVLNAVENSSPSVMDSYRVALRIDRFFQCVYPGVVLMCVGDLLLDVYNGDLAMISAGVDPSMLFVHSLFTNSPVTQSANVGVRGLLMQYIVYSIGSVMLCMWTVAFVMYSMDVSRHSQQVEASLLGL